MIYNVLLTLLLKNNRKDKMAQWNETREWLSHVNMLGKKQSPSKATVSVRVPWLSHSIIQIPVMLCLQQMCFIIYNGLWGTCLLVDLFWCYHPCSPRLFQVFWESWCRVSLFSDVLKLQKLLFCMCCWNTSFFELTSYWMYTLNAILYVMYSLNKIRQRGELSNVKSPYWSFRKSEQAFRTRQ